MEVKNCSTGVLKNGWCYSLLTAKVAREGDRQGRWRAASRPVLYEKWAVTTPSSYLSPRLSSQPGHPIPLHPTHTCQPHSVIVSPSCSETSRASPIPSRVDANSPDCRLRRPFRFVSTASPSCLFSLAQSHAAWTCPRCPYIREHCWCSLCRGRPLCPLLLQNPAR